MSETFRAADVTVDVDGRYSINTPAGEVQAQMQRGKRYRVTWEWEDGKPVRPTINEAE